MKLYIIKAECYSAGQTLEPHEINTSPLGRPDMGTFLLLCVPILTPISDDTNKLIILNTVIQFAPLILGNGLHKYISCLVICVDGISQLLWSHLILTEKQSP